MKKSAALITLLLCTAVLKTYSQTPFTTKDSTNINNICASILVHGDMWWDPTVGGSRCSFPKQTHKTIGFASSLWLSGYDKSGQLHVSSQTYRQSGVDFWPGPLETDKQLSYTESGNWNKIWKVSRADIQLFVANRKHTFSNTPAAILSWPGKGNTFATGSNGASLSIVTEMAPFVDLNKDGIYEPLSGEYPDIKGEQALWYVFNDNGPTHNFGNGKLFGTEIHLLVYAYKRGTLIDNVVYYEYTIVNRSSTSYDNVRAAIHADMDIGYAWDNFIGFDSIHRMGISYKYSNDGGSAGHPVNTYGPYSPMSGVSWVALPGDHDESYVPAGSFTHYYNEYTGPEPATTDTNCNNLMHSKLLNGQHVTNDYKGRGINSFGYGSGPECNYLFTGDPADTFQWSECAANDLPSDERFILSSNDFSLASGQSVKLLMALIAVDSVGGCPTASFEKIKIAADTAWAVYKNPPPAIPSGIAEKSIANIHMYPNPARDDLFIETTGNRGPVSICVFNMLGQRLNVPITEEKAKWHLLIDKLPDGMYLLHYQDDATLITERFIKE